MQSGLYPIRSRLQVKSDVSVNETVAESTATDQNTAESAAVGEVEESENETEIVQDAQENQEESGESGVTSDSDALDHNTESEYEEENIVQDAQFQNTGDTEGSEEQDAERSENVKEVIKEIILTNQPEADIQVTQTVPEMEYIISNDDYRVMSILLLAAILGAIVATALLNVINRGL